MKEIVQHQTASKYTQYSAHSIQYMYGEHGTVHTHILLCTYVEYVHILCSSAYSRYCGAVRTVGTVHTYVRTSGDIQGKVPVRVILVVFL